MRTSIENWGAHMLKEPLGLMVSYEGIDGSGKTHHIAALKAYLESLGKTVVVTREPGGTPLAEHLRSKLLHEQMDPVTETLLMFAARRDHLERVIVPALLRGDVVISDRFTDSTYAYQCGGKKVPLDLVDSLETKVQHFEHESTRFFVGPDLTLLFDIEPAVAKARLSSAREPDKFERSDEVFYTDVVAEYRRLAAAPRSRIRIIDADQTIESVWNDVLAVVKSHLA